VGYDVVTIMFFICVVDMLMLVMIIVIDVLLLIAIAVSLTGMRVCVCAYIDPYNMLWRKEDFPSIERPVE